MKNSRLNQSALDQTLQQAITEEILPFDQRLVQLTQKEHIQLKWQANFWKTQHERSIAREEILKKQLKQQHERRAAREEILKEEIKQKEAIPL